MKFSLANIKQIVRLIKELEVGLTKLSFNDNFDSFRKTVTITPSTVVAIRNELPSIPTGRIIIRQDVEAAISDSVTTWTKDFVYLENHNGLNTVILTVQFLK